LTFNGSKEWVQYKDIVNFLKGKTPKVEHKIKNKKLRTLYDILIDESSAPTINDVIQLIEEINEGKL